MRRIDLIFIGERAINGLPTEQRLAVRQAHAAPLVLELETWMRAVRGKMSRHADVSRKIDYMLKRWDMFSRSGRRLDLPDDNAAGRALRGVCQNEDNMTNSRSGRGGSDSAETRRWVAGYFAAVAAGSLFWTLSYECSYLYKHTYTSGSLIWEALSVPVFWLMFAMPAALLPAIPPFALGYFIAKNLNLRNFTVYLVAGAFCGWVVMFCVLLVTKSDDLFPAWNTYSALMAGVVGGSAFWLTSIRQHNT